MKQKIKLGVNVDHIATLRQARREGIPDLISSARQAIAGGADSIVAHLREDRRHIQDDDIYAIRKLPAHFDMEMAATEEMLRIALHVKPDMATIVPEKRQELTTEGGLDVSANLKKLEGFVGKLERSGIKVSLFIDPVESQIKAAAKTGASFIEIHTGKYAGSSSKKNLRDIVKAVKLAKSAGLRVNAGHGLDYNNVEPIARLSGIEELNIGFSIIARSVFVGLKKAVSDMKRLLIILISFGLFSFSSYAVTGEASATPEAATQATEEVKPSLEPYIVPLEGTTEGTTKPGLPEWLKGIGVTGEAVSAPPAAKKSTFSDVPADHWAAGPVEQLVKMGVTQGYPDGTFRGANSLSRYEMAGFLSKMAHAKETKAAENEKILEEFKSEVNKLKYTLDMYKKQPGVKRPIYGTFSARLRAGNIISVNAASDALKAPVGPVFDYRLTAGYRHEFNGSSFLRLGIDTMDSSITEGRDLVREMLEAEAVAETKAGFGVSITAGPGMVVHREGNSDIFPSEDYTVYLRPSNGIKLYYAPGDLETGIGYRATSIESSGAAMINDSYCYAGYTFRGTVLGSISLKYSIDVFNDNLRATYASSESFVSMYEMEVKPSKHLTIGLKCGVAASENTPHNAHVGLSVVADELFHKGNTMRLFASKTGTEFFDLPTYPGMLGVNMFNKLYQAGTYDFGLEVSQAISSRLGVKVISSVVTGPEGEYEEGEPKANSTFEFDLNFGVLDGAVMTLAYRVYQVPGDVENTTSDMIGLGFTYNF